MDKKIIFIPGWMSSSEYSKFGQGIDVWKDDVDYDQVENSDFIIGHSMGASVALKIWLSSKNAQLILVDPFIERKNIFITSVDWIKFYFKEEHRYDEYYLSLKYLPKNIIKLLKFPEDDYWKILESIPRDKLKVLHGDNDVFLCDKNVCDKFEKMGFTVINVADAGHDWHENFDTEIGKIVN